MAAKNKSINLLPQEEFEASTVGRVLKWAMGTFRIIVIVTEMVVMGAFLSRFWLDAQNSDLGDEINIKSVQVKAQSAQETQFRQMQTKLSIAKELFQETKPSDRVNLISAKMPQDIVLSSISLGDGSLQVKGISGSEIGIAQFISNLKSDQSFKKVELGSANSSEENPFLTIFTIKITY